MALHLLASPFTFYDVKRERERERLADLFLFSYSDGFFDAGMLLSALKANKDDEERPSDKAVRRREIGRRLMLAEY